MAKLSQALLDLRLQENRLLDQLRREMSERLGTKSWCAMTRSEFARRIQVNGAYLTDMCAGKRTFSWKVLTRIVETFGGAK